MVSEVALEFGGQIHCGDGGRGCALLGPRRERLRIDSYFCDFWVVGCDSALPSASSFHGRAVFATVSWRNLFSSYAVVSIFGSGGKQFWSYILTYL